MIGELLGRFEDNKIPLQITLDIDKEVCVDAFDHDKKLHRTFGETLSQALLKMAEELDV